MTINDYICRVLSEIFTDRYGVKVKIECCNQNKSAEAPGA